jgi:hypothetical protein
MPLPRRCDCRSSGGENFIPAHDIAAGVSFVILQVSGANCKDLVGAVLCP